MQKLSKLVLSLFMVVSLFIIRYSLFALRTSAQIPPPPVPCTDVKNPEFNSLRPYQASPCGNAPQSKFCGNKIIIKETMDRQKTTSDYCKSSLDVHWENIDPGGGPKDYWIDLSETEFPIAGNTEQVKNSQNPNDQFDDARKVNEYAGWYLNGVINRAEYGDTKNTDNEIVNFSGPVQKLLPSVILEAQRITSIENASKEVEVENEDDGKITRQPVNHNQIVVCAQEGFLGIIGKAKPHECYEGGGSKSKPDTYRLKDWEEDLSIFNGIANRLVTDVWNKRTPPLPWANENGKPFESDLLYRKAYNEWQGKTCVIVPIIGTLVCIDNPLIANKWADLYPYIPLSNTADRQYKMPIYTITSQPGPGTIMPIKDPRNVLPGGEPLLYYPHTYETKELSELLNKTYIPSGTPSGEIDPKTTEMNTYSQAADPTKCRVIDVRSNEGDDLFPIHEPGDIGVEVYFLVTQIPLVSCEQTIDPVTGDPEYHGKYSGLVTIEIHTDPVQVPWADQTWKSTVAGPTSTFRKIFPKVGKGAPVSCIADIPSETKAVYKPTVGTNSIGVAGPLGSVDETKMDPEDARIYFPHWGGIYEYFLKGIQTALRPQGYGEPLVNGKLCESAVACGELPKLPGASGSCALGGISSRVGNIPQSLKDVIEAAAETYKTPPNLILGIMYGEGLFDGQNKKDWTDENVKAWATCTPVPECSTSGDDNFLGFNSSDWQNILSRSTIEDDLKKLDPSRETPNQCNLLDAIYGLAWNLHDSADGSNFFPVGAKCKGIDLNLGTNPAPNSCDWSDDGWYESAIRVSEFGTGWSDDLTCATRENSCTTGGGVDAQCETDTATVFDTCNYANNSHNQCVWDVGHGN